MTKQDNQLPTIHPDITSPRVMDAINEDLYLGFCLACGEERDECEPDAQNYECHGCGAEMVFGAEEILIAYGDLLK